MCSFHGNTRNSQQMKRINSRLRAKVEFELVVPKDPTKIHHIKSNATPTTARLPSSWQQNVRFRDNVEDRNTRRALETGRVLNWCRTAHPLVPIVTLGDGNCLFYAVAVYIWGMADDLSLFLRRLVRQAFLDDQGALKNRWVRELRYLESDIPSEGLRLNSMDMEQEWNKIVDMSDFRRQDDRHLNGQGLPYHCVEEIHIFALANVIRRPIIVVSEPVMRTLDGATLAPNNSAGIYLPLLWEPKDCCKSPVVIGYHENHFVPLLSVRDAPGSQFLSESAEHAVPLVTNDLAPLTIHYVTSNEEAVAHELLTRYLQTKELLRTTANSVQNIPCAKLIFVDIEEDLDLLGVVFENTREPPSVHNALPAVNNLSGGQHQMIAPLIMPSPQQPLLPGPSATEGNPLGAAERQNSPSSPINLNLSTHPEAVTPRPVSMVTGAMGGSGSPRQQMELSFINMRCRTEGCPYYASKSTHPYCHECHKKYERVKTYPYDQHSSMHRLPLVEDQTSPEIVTSLGSYENQFAQKCTYPGCNNNARPDMHRMCSGHFKETSPSKCKMAGCDFFSSFEHDGYCSKCFNDVREAANMSSMQILAEVPRDPRANERRGMCQTFYKCISDVCNAMGSEQCNGYCGNCYIRNVRAGKIKRPTQKISNVPTEVGKTLCSTPGCEGLRAQNEVGMCTQCYQENMRNAIEANTRQAAAVVNLQQLPQAQPQLQPQPKRQTQTVQPVERQQSPSKKANLRRDPDPINFPAESMTYSVHGTEQRVCIMSGCENPGYEATNQLCQECFNVLCEHHARKANPNAARHLDRAGAPTEMVRKCKKPGCDMYGSQENNGFCHKCFMSDLYKDEAELPPGVDPLDSVEPILPAYMHNNPELVAKIAQEQRMRRQRKSRAKPCNNQACDLYGDPAFQGFCSQCYDRFYNPGNARTVIINYPSGGRRMAFPIRYSDIYITSRGPNRNQTAAVVMNQDGASPQTTAQTGMQIGNHNYMEVNSNVQTKMTESTGRCRVPNCQNYGNTKCKGFCNTCYPFYRHNAQE